MTYDLYIGDRAFSSWSLRGCLMFEHFGIPVRTHLLGLYAGTLQADLADLAPARTVPVVRTPEGAILTESIAIAETLAEQHPDIPFYPASPVARGLARSMVAEMHSGFGALRAACPMMLGYACSGFETTETVSADLRRVERLWEIARTRYGGNGAWLFGNYSLADAFYAPIATRIATYGLETTKTARAYVDTTLSDPAFRRWRAEGLTVDYDPPPYPRPGQQTSWPGPAALAAEPVETGTPINLLCPFSNKPAVHLARIDGRLVGFCNSTCRDKVVVDPLAWPEVTALLGSR